jgi:hypothetical protein
MRTTQLIKRCEEAALRNLLDAHQNLGELLARSDLKLCWSSSYSSLVAEQTSRMMRHLEKYRTWRRLRSLSVVDVKAEPQERVQ